MRRAPTENSGAAGSVSSSSHEGGTSHSQTSVQVNLFGRIASRSAPAEQSHETMPSSSTSSMPELAGHERVRAQKRKAPEGPRGRAKAGGRKTRDTCIPVSQRLIEFPDQSFKLSAGLLFCQACKEELANLKEGIKRHVASTKHQRKLSMFNSRMAADNALGTDLADYFDANRDEHGVSASITSIVACTSSS